MIQDRANEIKAMGRKYAKQAFHMNENDYIVLDMLERAYLAGYKRCFNDIFPREYRKRKAFSTLQVKQINETD